MNASRGPLVAATPALRARARFGIGSVTTAAPAARAIAADESREQLSTTTSSKRARGIVCFARLASSPGGLSAPSRTGTTTLTPMPAISGGSLEGAERADPADPSGRARWRGVLARDAALAAVPRREERRPELLPVVEVGAVPRARAEYGDPVRHAAEPEPADAQHASPGRGLGELVVEVRRQLGVERDPASLGSRGRRHARLPLVDPD